MKECTYIFNFVISKPDCAEPISDEVLDELQEAFLKVCEEEEVLFGGGSHQYFWLDDVLYWVTLFSMRVYWRFQHVKTWIRKISKNL